MLHPSRSYPLPPRKKKTAEQEFLFPVPVAARHIRLVALSGHGDKFAAVAEIEVLPAD